MAAQLKDLASIEEILKEMTLEEKAKFVIGSSPMGSTPMEKYGIPRLWTNDCCNGLNTFQYTVETTYREMEKKAAEKGEEVVDREKMSTMGGLLAAVGELQKKAAAAAAAGIKIPETQPIISYPTGISQASTWNPEVAGECAAMVAREFVTKGVDVILSPNINIHRDPLCGRLSESYSEDPYLVSRMAEAVVTNLQKEGIVANPKHFAANSQEKDRLTINEKISERALREIYFPAFKAAVDAGALTIMSAYNKINDESCAMNKWLLTDVLKKEWGFEGCVISDWGASYQQVPAVAAGTDLTMPGPRGIQCIIKAVEDGSLPMETLDDSCRRILRVIVKQREMRPAESHFDPEEAKKTVEKAVREGMVLLKNNGALPAEAEGAQIVFYGKRAKKFTAYSEGSGKVPSCFVTNPYDRAVEMLGEENVFFEALPAEKAGKKVLLVAVVGADGQEGADRKTMDMDADDRIALDKAYGDAESIGRENCSLILVTNATGPITIAEDEPKCDAILCPFFAGQAGGKAVADAIFGLYNPSGKLPDTWPRYYYDTPAYKNYGGENREVTYGEGIYVGYRWYDARHTKPLYPFGYGLSYTTFKLSNLSVEDTDVDKENIRVALQVENTGSREGAEVVQLYVRNVKTAFDKPEKELKGFQKVFLQPGEKKQVAFELKKEDLAHYFTELGDWVTEPGVYGICVGTSAADICLEKDINVSCRDPFGWTVITGIGKLVTNPKAVEIMNTALQADVMLVASVPIQYAPDYTLKQFWTGGAIAQLFASQGRGKAEMDAAWKYIVEEFKKL